ncbi:CRF protein, partial [Turnix velox]|nr:CRF protein [Turnix velox]
MRVRMISAAFLLVLLFLPSETCSPLQWPRDQLQPTPKTFWDLIPTPKTFWDLSSTPKALIFPQRLCRIDPAPRTLRGIQEKERRGNGKPNSLDLTFHLLRQFLHMSREERLAQKALSNKILLQNIGK